MPTFLDRERNPCLPRQLAAVALHMGNHLNVIDRAKLLGISKELPQVELVMELYEGVPSRLTEPVSGREWIKK